MIMVFKTLRRAGYARIRHYFGQLYPDQQLCSSAVSRTVPVHGRLE